MQRTNTTTKYPFLARQLRKRGWPTTETLNEQEYPLLRRPAEDPHRKDKPLPTLPEILEDFTTANSPERTPTPFPTRRTISSVIPFVENISSTYLSPSTLVAPEEPEYRSTPEWREFRNSLATDEEHRVARGVLIPAEPSPESSDVDSDNPETSIEQSSTAGLFYHRTQVPVHAVDTLHVITSNLEVLRQEDFTEGYHQTLERAYRLLRLASQVLETIPREVVQSPPRIRNFAEYLKHQIDYLRAKVINPENLSNPDLERDIAKLRSCLRARTLHQKFLRSTQRI